MKNFKSVMLIAVLGLSFLFMSYSSGGNVLYGTSSSVLITSENRAEVSEVKITRAAIALTKAAVRYTVHVVKVNSPGIRQVTNQMWVYSPTDNSKKIDNKKLKEIKINFLG